MAVSSSLNTQGFSSGAFVQIQQQQAQRNADQAEQNARVLQSRAQNARAVAGRAQEAARSLAVQASQAEGDASGARQSLSAMKSLGEVQAQLGGLRDQIDGVLNRKTDVGSVSAVSSASISPSSNATSTPVINAFGQTTGTFVNVTA